MSNPSDEDVYAEARRRLIADLDDIEREIKGRLTPEHVQKRLDELKARVRSRGDGDRLMSGPHGEEIPSAEQLAEMVGPLNEPWPSYTAGPFGQRIVTGPVPAPDPFDDDDEGPGPGGLGKW